MFEVGQQVTVITEKGTAYNGSILARATGDDGQKAYKIAMDGAGLTQLGQWHRSSEVFVIEPPPKNEPTLQMTSFLRH